MISAKSQQTAPPGAPQLRTTPPTTPKPVGNLTSAPWALRDRRQSLRLPSLIGAALVGLSLCVMIGWVLRWPALVQILPGFTAMVFNTALGLGLLGSALLLSADPDPRRLHIAFGLVALVLMLAAMNAVQLLTGITLGIDAPDLHAWLRDGHQSLGRMAGPTTTELILASTSFLLMHSPYAVSAWTRRGVRLLLAVMFSIAAMALVGYVLQLVELYTWVMFGFMAVHTAAAMLLLSLALWARLNEIEDRRGDLVEDRIIAAGTSTLMFVALLAGLTSTLNLKDQAEREIAESLKLVHKGRVDLLLSAVELHSMRAALVASRPELQDMLHRQAQRALDGTPGPVLIPELEAFRPYGFTDIALLSPDGKTLAHMAPGRAVPEMSLALSGTLPGQPRLVWRDGYALVQRFEVRRQERLEGYIETEQTMTDFDRQLRAPSMEVDDGQTELCGRDAAGTICFPNREHDQLYRVTEWEGQTSWSPPLAHEAQREPSLFQDAAGLDRVAAYGVLGDTGLRVRTSLLRTTLYAPLRTRLSRSFLLVILVTALGAWALRRSIQPLTRALGLSEQRYRAVVDNLSEGVVLQDRNAVVLASNPAAARIFGMTQDELLGAAAGDPGWEVIHEDGSPCAVADLPAPRTLRTGAGVSRLRLGVRDRAGCLRWLEFDTQPVDGLGDPAVVVTYRDITSEKLAQQRLSESESRYQQMIDQVLDYAILMLDAQGNIASWNQGAERIKGYAADEIIGQHFSCFFTAEDQQAGRPQQELETAARLGRCEASGLRVRKDGSRLWGHVVLTAVRNARGELLGFSKVTQDLTARHLAEQQLAEVQRRMQAMIEFSPLGIIATDLQGVIRDINPVGAQLVGYRREELVDKLTPSVFHDPEELRTRARELSEETGQTIEPGLEAALFGLRQGRSEEREWICIRKDGTRFNMQISTTPLRDATGATVGFMGVFHDITERKRREEYTQHIAHHDTLTGLPTRRLMDDRLQMAMQRAHRSGSKVGLLMIDLDHFKRINDSLGHHVGDELLKEVAERLSSCVRSSDTVARMGGDEFVIILAGIPDTAAAERVALLAVSRICMPVQAGQHTLHVSPSIGIAMYPEDSLDPKALLRHADAAMYAAKSAGRSCYRMFTPKLQREVEERMALESDLRLALQREELQVHYQPQICLKTGDVIGMEALVRWTHPVRGPISPAMFIPVAEESGLIVPLGEWVLRRACKSAREMQIATGVMLRLAVNLSPQQFRSPNLIEMIGEALRDSGLAAADLEVEITEGVLMEDADEVIQRLNDIRSLGVSIAVDDFGTGYSSLSYITRFAIDTLKIDRSFVSRLPDNPSDAAVAQAIVALSMSLGFKVIAEGVETAEQLAFLRDRQCDMAQGFLIGRPTPSDQFSVQGFHFSPARTPENLTQTFTLLQDQSRSRVRALH